MSTPTAPLFTWPQTSLLSTRLDFGRFGGLSYREGTGRDIQWFSANNSTHKRVNPITPLAQVFPHTRRYSPAVKLINELESPLATQSVKYLQERYPEFDVPSDFLVDILAEELNKEIKSENCDPYVSAQLISLGEYEAGPGQTNKFMAFPIGQAGSELCFTPMTYHEKPRDKDLSTGHYQMDLSAISKLKFKTPIRQITTTSLNASSSSIIDFKPLPPLMAVRTMTGTTFLRILNIDSEMDNSGLKALTLDTIPGQISGSSFDQMHITFNPMLYGEAVIVDAGGGVYLWTAERNQHISSSNIVETIIASQDQEYVRPTDLWRICEFAAHPQCLFVASRKTVDLLDFRAPVTDTTTINLFDINDGDHIFAFQRFPTLNSFQSILATRNDIILLDQRFPNRELLKWVHHRGEPSGLSMINDGGNSIVLTWTKNIPKLNVFQFSTSDLVSATDFPISIPSFHEHPTFNRSRYIRSTLVCQPRLYQSTEETQPPKLPPLGSVILLKNDVKYREGNTSANPIMCFSAIQLSHTGALYSQEFYLNHKADTFSEQDTSKLDDTQIIEMPDTVSTLQTLADRDVGTNPEMQFKTYRIWPLDKIWNYAAREFRFPFYKDTNSDTLSMNSVFSSWELVETFFENYAQSTGFMCSKKSVTYDILGDVRSVTFYCENGKLIEKTYANGLNRFYPCTWKVTLSRQKLDDQIFITKLSCQHNHELFSTFYYSQRRIHKQRIESRGLGERVSKKSKKSGRPRGRPRKNVQSVSQTQEAIEERSWRITKEVIQTRKMDISHISWNTRHYLNNSDGHILTPYEILKNVSSLDNSNKGLQSFRNENTIKIVDWNSAEMKITLEQISNIYGELRPIFNYSLSYGFPLNNTSLNNTDDSIREIKATLRRHYPLPLSERNLINPSEIRWADENWLQKIENDLINGSFPSNVKDKIKILRDFAIDEVAHDLIYSLYALASNEERSSRDSLTSHFLPISKSTPEAATLEPIGIKCTHSKSICKKQVILEELQSFKLTTFAQSLLDDWTIGQDPKEYEFCYRIDDTDTRIQSEGDIHQPSSLTVIRSPVPTDDLSSDENEESFNDLGRPTHSQSSQYDSEDLSDNFDAPTLAHAKSPVAHEFEESVNPSNDTKIEEDNGTKEKPKKRARISGF
ncbi:7283_t:CDS:10 [Acaulospora morrowiae]|uniref:7283_t:CDS:1 n=1 Tax=Acaulospora morrowiae TaxID=94023 RepID=A0A9N9FVL2_9GLOM|nr:7283_t:CDS:10 [Acaulospora morrowiae]